uniref:Uncharacterized protein n=1 Tax=Anguilla anguilla TaxID=7936 RepID=A0A0E9U9I2_ANGAN
MHSSIVSHASVLFHSSLILHSYLMHFTGKLILGEGV